MVVVADRARRRGRGGRRDCVLSRWQSPETGRQDDGACVRPKQGGRGARAVFVPGGVQTEEGVPVGRMNGGSRSGGHSLTTMVVALVAVLWLMVVVVVRVRQK
ncbi:hypothetical protein vseg_013355 [Gypsophila vaccaria]